MECERAQVWCIPVKTQGPEAFGIKGDWDLALGVCGVLSLEPALHRVRKLQEGWQDIPVWTRKETGSFSLEKGTSAPP